MADTTTSDAELMDVEDSNESAASGSVHTEKNGISEDDDTATKLIKKPIATSIIDDDSLSNSNHDIDTDGDELTINDSVCEDKEKDEDDIADNASDSQEDASDKPSDSKVDESKESNGTSIDSPMTENHKDSDCTIVENSTEKETTPIEASCSSSTDQSEKQSCNLSETDSPKPSPIHDILVDMSPKCSPEVIVSTLSPFLKDRFESNDSSTSKAKDEKESESNSNAVLNDVNCATSDSKVEKENETESKTKHESKSGKKKKNKICAECEKKKKLPLRIVFHGQVHQLCSEVCYKNFKERKTAKPPAPVTVSTENCAQCKNKIECGPGLFPSIGEVKPLCSEECMKKYHEDNGQPKNCGHCKKRIESIYNQLTWETMVFCNEDCLGKYQSFLGSHCTCCQSPVQQTSLGKYCVCFGADIRQFCSGSCLEEFKKGLKVCSFCQTDLSAAGEGFLAPVGDKGQFKDFCSQQCMERYEVMNNVNKSRPDLQECSHCKKQGSFKTQIKYGDKTYSLCCDICVAGFRCSYQIKDNMCGLCFKIFKPDGDESYTFKFEGLAKHFCTKACMTLFVLSHRKIIQCGQCKVKKYTFDMIEKIDSNNHAQMFCSLNCLSLYRVNLSATSSQKIRCDNCLKTIPAQYHLTMSDGSIRNFCNYDCVVAFQKECLVSSMAPNAGTRPASTVRAVVKSTSSGTSPVIANVVSLAQARTVSSPLSRGGLVPQTLVSVRQQGPSLSVLSPKSQVSSSTVTSTSTLSVALPSPGGPMREIIVRPPAPKSVKNKSASCKPIMQTKGVNAKLQTCHKAVQTDDRPMPIILPVPFPIYIPTPMHMFSRPVPCPVPFPVPIPVPIIIYKDKPSSNSCKNCLSRAAEKAAEDDRKIITESSQKVSTPQKRKIVEVADSSPEIETVKSTTQSPLDQVNSHSNNNTEAIIAPKIEPVDDYYQPIVKPKRKKRSGELILSEIKKPKLEEDIEVNNLKLSGEDGDIDDIMNTHFEDADKKLKYAFGVNAWKQWILEKNARMSRETKKRVKSFQTDITKLTAKELNNSLSLFVNEVTRPNGQPYTAGALFYLLLGIQLYLSENGRSDDLFSDDKYSLFSEHFHDVLLQYETRALAQEVPWSRIKEDFLWDSRQLGAQSPQILLNTLLYFNTKYFKMRTIQSHMNLNFSHISRHTENSGSFLRYYGPCNNGIGDTTESIVKKEKVKEEKVKEEEVNEEVNQNKYLVQPENNRDQLRCPVRLFEFYLSKCPPHFFENDSHYYCEVVKDFSARKKVWFTDTPLSEKAIAEKLQRIKLIEDIYEY